MVVLDEIEKAHPDLFNILLQVMDHATLTDNNGRKADFRNVILILTTNAGAREMSSQVASASAGGRRHRHHARRRSAIERTFSPSSATASTAWMLFARPAPEVILKVVDKEVGLLQKLLDEKKVQLELTPAAREWLAEHGYDPQFGARPMARLVDNSAQEAAGRGAPVRGAKEGGVAQFDVKADGRGLTLQTDSVAPATV